MLSLRGPTLKKIIISGCKLHGCKNLINLLKEIKRKATQILNLGMNGNTRSIKLMTNISGRIYSTYTLSANAFALKSIYNNLYLDKCLDS